MKHCNDRRRRPRDLPRRRKLNALTADKPLRLRVSHLLCHAPVPVKVKYIRRHDLVVGIHARGRDLAT